jgi:hypothetical protein
MFGMREVPIGRRAKTRSRFCHNRLLPRRRATKTFGGSESVAVGASRFRGEEESMARSGAGFGIVVASAVCLGSSGCLAQESDSPLKSVMKIMGFATDLSPPADFVIQSRPKGEPDYIPVFQAPPEPARPALNDKQLRAVKSDLDSVEKRDDAIRRAFPPAVNATAEEAPARKGKTKPAAATH